jgi:hypothetical protein
MIGVESLRLAVQFRDGVINGGEERCSLAGLQAAVVSMIQNSRGQGPDRTVLYGSTGDSSDMSEGGRDADRAGIERPRIKQTTCFEPCQAVKEFSDLRCLFLEALESHLSRWHLQMRLLEHSHQKCKMKVFRSVFIET